MGDLVLGDWDLPDRILVKRVKLVILQLSTVTGAQIVDVVGGSEGLCLHASCPEVSGVLYSVVDVGCWTD